MVISIDPMPLRVELRRGAPSTSIAFVADSPRFGRLCKRALPGVRSNFLGVSEGRQYRHLRDVSRTDQGVANLSIASHRPARCMSRAKRGRELARRARANCPANGNPESHSMGRLATERGGLAGTTDALVPRAPALGLRYFG